MSRVLTDSLTHAHAECEKPNRHYVPSMTIFQNKSFLFYKSKPLDGSQCQLAFPKLCVFMHLWATDFRVYTARRRPFQHFYYLSPPVIMSNRECRVFNPWGRGLPELVMPNVHIFHFQNRATHFGRYPLLPSPPSNTKHIVDQPCPHDIPSNTKHIVD